MAKHRTGVFFGTFDPIHEGHIRLCLAALSGGDVDRILVVPLRGLPDYICAADPEDRWRMTVAACSVDPRLEPLRVALDAPESSRIVDLLRQIRRRDDKSELILLLGSDALLRLRELHHAKEILKSFRFLIAPRPEQDDLDALKAEVLALSSQGVRLRFLLMDPISASSSRIRSASVMEEDSGLPIDVEEYIAARGLYAQDIRIPQAGVWLPRLFAALNPHRFSHSLSVARTARRLALIHGLQPLQAEEAGLLHDCAKCMPIRKMQQIAREHSLTVDPAYLQSGALLHSLVGAWVARNEYGMADPQVLEAISYHNTGIPGMSRLAMCVCLADSIEPLRGSNPRLDAIREVADKNLERALLLSLEGTSAYVRERGKELHPRTLQTIAWLQKLPGVQVSF